MVNENLSSVQRSEAQPFLRFNLESRDVQCVGGCDCASGDSDSASCSSSSCECGSGASECAHVPNEPTPQL